MQDNSHVPLISDVLESGETILWAGKPKDIKLLEAPFGTSIIIQWAMCALFAAAAVWYGLIYAPSAEMGSGTTIMLICILLAAALAIRPVFDVNSISKKCIYYITDKRAIVFIKGAPTKTKSRDLSTQTELSVDMLDSNRGIIYIGKKTPSSIRKCRAETLSPAKHDGDQFADDMPLMFYSVEDPYEIIKFFPSTLKVVN